MYRTGKTKFLSILLTLVLIVCSLPVFAANAQTQEPASDSLVYYVKGGAEGDGSSYDTPAGTITALLTKINADGNNVAGKRITVKIINSSSYFHYNYDGGAVIPSHAATLCFESYDSESMSYLSVSPRKVGSTILSRSDAQHLKLGGPAEFKNLKLLFGRTSGDWLEMYMGGYDASFENVLLYGFSNDTYTSPKAVSSSQTMIAHGAYNNSADGEGGTLTIDGATINNNKLGYASASAYASSYSDQRTLENDVKIVLGNGTFNNELRVGGSPAKDTVTFKKNLNIVLNGTTVPTLYSRNYISAMTEGHAMQIIYNGGAKINSETTGSYGFANLTRYDIHVENIEGAALDTTAIAGTYKISFPEGKTAAKAVDEDGTEYFSKGNTITVGEPGTYNVTFLEALPLPTYYLKGGASGNGTSAENAAGSLATLVAQIEADGNNIKGQEVSVKVIANGTTYVYYNTENNKKSTTAYEATLIFESADPENPSVIGVTNSSVTTRGDQHLRISGPTKFINIGIAFNRSYTDWMETYCGGYDVTFENVQLYGQSGKVPSDNGNRIIVQGSIDGIDGEGGTLIIDGATISKNHLGYVTASSGVNSSSYSDQCTMENDVKLVLGNGIFKNELRVGGATNGSSIAFKKNLNIVLNGTTIPLLFSRNSISAMTEGHAMQIIYNGGASIASETTGTYGFANLTRYDIFVENTDGASLDTTETAGTYAVTYPDGKSMVYCYAVDAQGNYDGVSPIYYSEGETVTVGAPGRYKAEFCRSVSDIALVPGGDGLVFEGWNNTADGILTPVFAPSVIVETSVTGDAHTIIYTADVKFEEGTKTIVTTVGNTAEKDVFEISESGMKIAGYATAGKFGYGTYGVKVELTPASYAAKIEITTPDGEVIRRGDSATLAGNTSYTMIKSATTYENGVTNSKITEGTFTPESYVINSEAPAYSGFEEKVYNIVTSYDADAKTTRSFAFTAKTSFVSADETMQVRYNVYGSTDYMYVDAVRKTEKTVYEDVDFFEADITNLVPGTTYEYSIGKKDSTDWSDTYTFKTESAENESFSFITISDTQGVNWDGSRGFMYADAALDEALEDVEDPAFILNVGDVIEGNSSSVGSGTDLEVMWENYFKALGDAAKSVAHFAVMGNHDYHGHGGSSNEGFLFNMHFNHPNNGGKSAIPMWGNMGNSVTNVMNNPEETAYSFDYGDAHFIVLNSGPDGGTDKWLLGAQKTWLTNDLEANKDAKWTIVSVHQEVYEASGVNENFSYYELNKLFEENGVDLVITGHVHYNARTYPMMNGKAVTKENPDFIEKDAGTVYSIVGSTATNHDILKDNLNENYVSVFSPASEMPVYATVDVTKSSLTYTVKQLDGYIVDQFTIFDEEEYYTPDAVGAQIRVPTSEGSTVKQGLRFIGKISAELYDELEADGILPETNEDKGEGFGIVVLPTNKLAGASLTKNTEKAYIVPAVKLYEKTSDKIVFTACLTGIPEDKYETEYSNVPYVTLADGTTYYGEQVDVSIYDVAKYCYTLSDTSDFVKQYLLEKILNKVDPEMYPMN